MRWCRCRGRVGEDVAHTQDASVEVERGIEVGDYQREMVDRVTDCRSVSRAVGTNDKRAGPVFGSGNMVIASQYYS